MCATASAGVSPARNRCANGGIVPGCSVCVLDYRNRQFSLAPPSLGGEWWLGMLLSSHGARWG